MSDSIIKISNLNFKYSVEDSYTLRDINFDIKKNSWTTILGQNGSGKSTLTRLIDGILIPDSGDIEVSGLKLTDESVWDIRKKIGIVFQNPDNQFVGATVEDDVAFGLENIGINAEEMHKRVKNALKEVHMEDFSKRDPQSLSGGQKQRVALAGIIALEPEIIILDEATSMLDPSGREEILKIIKELKDNLNLTIISITHDLDEIEFATDIIVLNKGEILKVGKPEEIFNDSEVLKQIKLGFPFAKEVQTKLIKAGIDIKDTWMSEKELLDTIWKYHLNK